MIEPSPGFFRLTFQEAQDAPQRRVPAFPPYCVVCCQRAEAFAEETCWIFGPEDGLKPLKVTLRIPRCAKHAATVRRRNLALIATVVLGMLAIIATSEVIALHRGTALRGDLFWGILAGIVTFFTIGPLLFRAFGAWEPSGFVLRDASKYGHIAFYFDNMQYEKLFARENDWKPFPEPPTDQRQGAA